MTLVVAQRGRSAKASASEVIAQVRVLGFLELRGYVVSDRPGSLTVEHSGDGKSWTAEETPGEGLRADLQVPVRGRYVRVTWKAHEAPDYVEAFIFAVER